MNKHYLSTKNNRNKQIITVPTTTTAAKMVYIKEKKN